MMLRLFFVCVLNLYATLCHALEPFVIEDIRVEGIQRTELGTVFKYLPLKAGDTLTEEKAAQSIKALYATGFFKDVKLEAQDKILVLSLVERPAISQIDFVGNKMFPTDKMREGLRGVGLSEGMIFDRSLLERSVQEIKRQYLTQGKYSAEVKATESPLPRNRVAIRFEINEGAVSKIRGIKIVGNQTFKESELLDQFELTTPGWFTWWSQKDRYSKQKLAADLETLRSFYMNRGYLDFSVDSTQVSITPDKSDIYITVNITEGDQYTVSDVKLAGDTLLPPEEMQSLITLQSGQLFNRQKLTASSKALGDKLANDGYAFANVNPVPAVNKQNHTVAFTFYVDPGRKIYVRRVNIAGNPRTRDSVIRREVRQMESGWYALDKINRSKERINRLGYFSDVTVETPAVPGTADQVDVNFNVKERSTGSIMLGAGISSTEGLVLGATISQSNFLGTGDAVNLQVHTGKINTVYALSYLQPYYTQDGISRGFDLYRRDLNTTSLNVGGYKTSAYGTGISFGIPLNERDSISSGLTLDRTSITLGSASSNRYKAYCLNQNSCADVSLKADLSWIHDTRDSIFAPTRGLLQNATGEFGLPGTDQEYYKLTYKHHWYTPLGKDFTLLLGGELGYAASYGSAAYPFFKNFYSGGPSSVRGYAPASLGPLEKDTAASASYAVGGTRRASATAELFFPFPLVKDTKQLRLSAFLDVGSVWSPTTVAGVIKSPDSCRADSASDCLRYSAGLGFNWFSPFGPIKIVFAKALNKKPGDRTETIQFQLGSTF